MNEKKIIKFNLIMSCVILSVFVLMFLGVTIAYFTDRKQATSTFTSGNVEITLVESAVRLDEYGNYVKDTTKRMSAGKRDLSEVREVGRVYPGTSVYKDPTITNTGDAPEWLAAKVTLTDGKGDLHKVIGYPGYEEIDIERLITGGLLDEPVDVEDWNGIADVCVNDRYAMIQVANTAEGKYEFYFLMLEPVAVGESIMLFDHLVFDQVWNNAQMQEFAELTIDVQAYGVQLHQLADCFTAMTSAFPEHFPFNSDIK